MPAHPNDPSRVSLRKPVIRRGRPDFARPPRKRILLVDDEADTLAVLRIWLMELGFDVSLAINGTDALCRVQETLPDLIVTDQSMPRMTGLELCARLRSRARTRRIPILIYSAQPLEPGGEGLYDRAVRKPASLTRIADEIASLLRSNGFG